MNNKKNMSTNTGQYLYEYVKDLPIIDYHNHLSIKEISKNERFLNIYDLWIKPDPYKHRAMRMCGILEKYITGDACKKEKFIKWCETVPQLIGNPLYDWSLSELESVFNITEVPCKENALKIYNFCNDYLSKNNICADTLLKKFRVECACPCMSITNDVSIFNNNKHLSPSLRGDDIVNLSFIQKLKNKPEINNLQSLKRAVSTKLDDFQAAGCFFTDHSLDNGFKFYEDDRKNEERFKLLLNNNISEENMNKLSSYMLEFLANEYSRRNFTMQLHIGAQRYTSTKLRKTAGSAGGFACIGNSVDIVALTKFLDVLDRKKYRLPKTILFTLNPADNAMISSLSGSYSKDGVSGLVTQGPAWWWCDHKYGIIEMLENTSSFGVLSNFIGMTTDSRSFLSFVRHDYFRKILCDWLGKKTESGDFNCSIESLKNLAAKICYKNAKGVIHYDI